MNFEHSRESYRAVADALIAHIGAQLGTPLGRKKWTEDNFNVLQTFTVDGKKLTWCPTRDDSKPSGLKGQFLWDFMGFNDQDVIVIAESEWLSGFGEIAGDFEKLLYTRCPVKLMMCGKWKLNPEELAEKLSKYAQSCSCNYGCGEVFVLYCVGWIDDDDTRNDQVFSWQVDGQVATGKDLFEFKPFAADRPLVR